MRDIFTGFLAGLCGAVTYWVSLMLMLAREGIGPGDSLSTTGYVIPTILGGLAIVAIVAGSPRRLMGSCIFWLSLFVILVSLRVLVGKEADLDLIRFSIVAIFIHFPAASVILVKRIRAIRRPD
jgi:hypothetical protein